jgi:acyl-CoA thioester hydrolase
LDTILAFSRPVALRWADFDANFHLRHSAYYDFGATMRLEFLNAQGLTYELMATEHFGPILFREEAIFKREVRLGDTLSMNVLVTKLRRDGARFSFRHELTRGDGTLCAVINVDGAWIDTQARKLTVPPAVVLSMFEAAPKSEDFAWLD